jgi:hypothetical protein
LRVAARNFHCLKDSDELSSLFPAVLGQKSAALIDLAKAKQQLNSMNCSIHKNTFGAMIASLNKIFRHAFEGIYVDQPGISALRNLSYQSFN